MRHHHRGLEPTPRDPVPMRRPPRQRILLVTSRASERAAAIRHRR
jgi:hypothetical protein